MGLIERLPSNDMLQTLLLFLGFDERDIGMDLSKSDLPHTKDRYYDTGHGLKLIRETHKDKLQEVLKTLE